MPASSLLVMFLSFLPPAARARLRLVAAPLREPAPRGRCFPLAFARHACVASAVPPAGGGKPLANKPEHTPACCDWLLRLRLFTQRAAH